MKTNSIFSKSFLSTLLFMAVSAISFDGFAQCNPAFTNSSPVILPLCATGSCNTVVVTIQVPNPSSTCSTLGTASPVWRIINNGINAASGIIVVGTSTSGTNPVVHSITLQCKPTNAGGNAMKARLVATWEGVCGGGAEFVRAIDIFKQYTENNGVGNGRLDELSNDAGGAVNNFSIASGGSPCATANSLYTFSVPPLATNPPSDEIGQDSYFWRFPSWEGQNGFAVRYSSGDKSSVTIITPLAIPQLLSDIWVKVGNANTPNTPAQGNVHAILQMTRNALPIKVASSVTNMTGWCRISQPSGEFLKESVAYLPANQGSQTGAKITLTAETGAGLDPQFPDANYTWTYPTNAFDLLSIDLKRRTIELKPKTGTAASMISRITVTLAKGQCGFDAASITINRDFSTAGSPAYNRISPQPDATCYLPGRSYTFTVTNSPAGNYFWLFSGGWQITQGQNTPTVTVVAGTGSPAVSVTAMIPPDGTNPPACVSRINTLNSSGYTVAGDGGLDIVIKRSTINLSIEKADGSNWTPPGCSGSNFLYTWQFRGERSTNSGATWQAPYGSWDANGGTWFPAINSISGNIGDGDPIFTSPVIPNTSANTFNGGLYRKLQTTGAPSMPQFRLTIRHNPLSICTTQACFFVERIYNLPPTQYRPVGGSGSDPKSMEDLGMLLVNGLSVMPNPSNGDILVQIDAPAAHAILVVKDASGREVHRLSQVSQSQNLNLKHLPKGMYFIEYLGGSEKMGGRIILE